MMSEYNKLKANVAAKEKQNALLTLIDISI